MSTTALTVVVVVALVAGLFTASVAALYRRRLAAAALAAAAMCATAHIVFVMSAWEEAASAYLDAPPTMPAAMPPISSLPTAMYDAPAWAAMVLLATGIVFGAIEWKHRRAAEKEMVAFLKDLFGINKPEENKSEEG